jgi:hypothetical protein
MFGTGFRNSSLLAKVAINDSEGVAAKTFGLGEAAIPDPHFKSADRVKNDFGSALSEPKVRN